MRTETVARDSLEAADSAFRRRWTWRRRVKVAVWGFVIAFVLQVLYATLRVRCVDPGGVREARRAGGRFVWAFWHDGLVLLPLVVIRVMPFVRPTVMLSWHRDGEIAAQAVRRFGVRSVRGSSTRGWLGGLRGLLQAHGRGDDIVVVPDGPRGPRHVAKEGVAQLARATGVPVVVMGAAARPVRRLRSWDRLQVPLPFASVVFVLRVVSVGTADGEAARLLIERALTDVHAAAAAALGAPTG